MNVELQEKFRHHILLRKEVKPAWVHSVAAKFAFVSFRMSAGLNLCKPVHESLCLSICLSVRETGTFCYWRLLRFFGFPLHSGACGVLCATCWEIYRVQTFITDCAFCRVISSVRDQGNDVWDV